MKLTPGTPIATIIFDNEDQIEVVGNDRVDSEHDTLEMIIVEVPGQMAMVPFVREVRRNGDVFMWNVACIHGLKLADRVKIPKHEDDTVKCFGCGWTGLRSTVEWLVDKPTECPVCGQCKSV